MKTNELQVHNFPNHFPNGELHVKSLPNPNSFKVDRQGYIWISKRIKNSDDIMEILFLVDSIRRTFVSISMPKLGLRIPYVPYSRQDRVMVEGESLSIKVFADLINSIRFDQVEIWDPHSDVTPALINNCFVRSQEELLLDFVKYENKLKDCILVCPDAGARKKIMNCAKEIKAQQIIHADKIRDVETGCITGTTINWEGLRNKPTNFLIVDDICEGGRTFIEIAKQIYTTYTLSPLKIYLYVTYGFFTAGLEELRKYFSKIYVANLMNEEFKDDPLLCISTLFDKD
jgi:ribose-phosphate pyrophosphokinase